MQRLKKVRKSLVIAICLFLINFCLFAWAQSNPPEIPQNASPEVRHIIIMIGDGMGGWHGDAARKYAKRPLVMASLAHHGYMTTYMRNTVKSGPVRGEYWDDASQTGRYDPASAGETPWDTRPRSEWAQKGYTDSAAAASAMLSGRKTVRAALNVLALDDGYPGDRPDTVMYRPTIADTAKAAGKATGVVTSVQFQHATAAATVVKTQYRRNQGEKARQMIDSDLDVIMGGGHPDFDANGKANARPDYTWWSSNKSAYLEDENGELLYNKVAHGFLERRFIQTKADFEDLGDGDGRFKGAPQPKRVFGLAPVARTLQYERNLKDGAPSNDWQVGGQAYVDEVPDLKTMARGALAVLAQNKEGFWLMIEGGAIDWASHSNDMTRMLEEMLAFDAAVQAVIDWIENPGNASSWTNTLLIVTADHETGHLQPSGNVTGDDVIRHQCWGVDCAGWRHHTNRLVPIYAQGPGAEFLAARFKGDYRDNTDIFRTMQQALERSNIKN